MIIVEKISPSDSDFIINPETKNYGEIITRPSPLLITQYINFNLNEIVGRVGDEAWCIAWRGNLKTARRITVNVNDYNEFLQKIEMDMLNMAIWYKKNQ